MSKKPFMVTLLPSVDCDLARWLLDHWQMEYDEHPHAPIFHILALKWYGEGKDDYPLIVDQGKKVPTVDTIAPLYDAKAPLDRRLIPDAEKEPKLHKQVMTLQKDFRWNMGEGTVHWAYFHLLPHKNLTWKSFTTGVPWWEPLFLTFGYGIMKYLMFIGLGLGPDDALKGLDKVKKGFDQCEALIADGRSYLAGDRLTFADLAFASSAAPMILADGYSGFLPPVEACPEDMQKVVLELRRRPAGQFCQRIYNEHRKKPSSQRHGGI